MTETPPPRLLSALQLIAKSLSDLGGRFALIGGLAVSARSEPRFTRDIDLAVSVDTDAHAEQLVSDLVARGFRLQLSLDQQATNRLASVRLSPPDESNHGIVVDLLFASSGIEADICDAADTLDIAHGVRGPVRICPQRSLIPARKTRTLSAESRWRASVRSFRVRVVQSLALVGG